MSNDILVGTNDNDIFHGGTGADIVTFAGNAAGYRIDVLSDGRVRVVDIDAGDGDTGRDILSGIDTLQFADASFKLESIATAQGQVRINAATTSGQYFPAISALADGGYVTSWVSGSSVPGEEDIYFQRYDANGNTVGSETYVGTYTTRNPFPPPVTVLADGGFVITWGSFTVGQGYDIYAQRYDANGLALGSQTLVNTYLAIDQNYAATTALADGGYVITWQSFGEDGSGWGIYAQRYGADGLAVGGETRINTYTSSDQLHPAVTALADGGYLITWDSHEQDGSGLGIYAQRYGADGLAVGGETRINTFTTDYQSNSAVAALADGGYLIAWVSAIEADGWTNDIYAQRYDAMAMPSAAKPGSIALRRTFNFRPPSPRWPTAAMWSAGYPTRAALAGTPASTHSVTTRTAQLSVAKSSSMPM